MAASLDGVVDENSIVESLHQILGKSDKISISGDLKIVENLIFIIKFLSIEYPVRDITKEFDLLFKTFYLNTQKHWLIFGFS